MRSHSFLRKSQLLIKHSAVVHDFQPFLQSRASCSFRNKRLRPIASSLTSNRFISSSAVPPVEPDEDSTTATSLPSELPKDSGPAVDSSKSTIAVEDPDKLTSKLRRTRITPLPSNTKDADSLELPAGLDYDILYSPGESVLHSLNSGLPPPEIFEEALNNLLITLHPQNQHRAIHAPGGSSRSIEPTLGLYCPIEGGDYVIDLTVHELAYRTGAEVLVLDAVQLAAGEWGQFGKAASSLNLPKNPLHFSSPSPPAIETTRQASSAQDQDEEDSPFMFSAPSRMSISLPVALSSLQGRALLSSGSRKPVSPSKVDVFFETLVNMPFPPVNADGTSSKALKNRPRLIYIRDFPTLAPFSSSWYPSLLAAVKQRRRGLLSRTSTTTSSPVTIIFGMTPPVIPPWNEGSSGPTSSIMNLLMNRNSSSQMAYRGKNEYFLDWSESENAELAREKRLRSRLKKWEKNAAGFQEEFPKLSTKQDSGDNSSNPDIIVIGGPDGSSGMPPMNGMIGIGVVEADGDTNSRFFRSSVLVPGSRSVSDERETRIARRREINELTIRMGVGAVGGVVESSPAFPDPETLPEEPLKPSSASPATMWEEWGSKIEEWSNVRKIADRALGSVMVSQQALSNQEKITLTPTVVPWPAVQSAWATCHSLRDARRNWLRETMGHKSFPDDLTEAEETVLDAGSSTDKVVESIKNDPDLDQHEARLLSCIVDAHSITTTFKQVHLPSHTVDSVRTIVSLPLLHPHAFQEGILKEHSMTGCLLFGPPGTGKTLVVRALAKEAGCRMLAISPSDVMDMYVGEGEKLVRAVFSLARRLSPCVVFLDEIDALFGARMSARESGSAFAHRGVITEFMQEMDGLKSSKEDNVIVIGATNRPFDLDDAVLRRLPRRLLVDLPGEKEREEILKILLRDEALASDVSVDALAKKTDGFSGSDLKHLCVSAALDSVKEHMEVPWLSKRNTAILSTPATVETETQLSSNDAPVAVPSAGESDTVQPTSTAQSTSSAENSVLDVLDATRTKRILHLRNFSQALKEITPSSSEILGSLSELRKWNDEFGEGRKDRKRHQVWGKGRFGFVDSHNDAVQEGRVAK